MSELAVALGRVGATSARKGIVWSTLLLGAVVAVGVIGDAESFGDLALPVQSTMSIGVPLIGALLTSETRRAERLGPTIGAAVVYAVAVSLFGAVVCAIVLAASSPGEAAWDNTAAAIIGGVLVQSLAQLVGTAAGQLVRPAVVAALATIVVPLGLWAMLRGTDVRQWLTPAATLEHLLPGELGGLTLVRWLVVFLIWGVGLNLLGALARRRRALSDRALAG